MFGNVMADFMFKRLFGNKLIMLPFLKMVLPEENIADIDYINTEELGDTPLDNKVVFDIACTTSDGRELIIEMQKATTQTPSTMLKRSVKHEALQSARREALRLAQQNVVQRLRQQCLQTEST
jgi:predicted transposase/invertase (TIGR01784 family)